MDYQLGFLSQYIAAAEIVGKEPTLTIGATNLESVESMKIGDDDGKGKTKDRIVIYFKGKDGLSKRGWLLNRTNALCLVEMFGRETDQWIGKRITLHALNVRVGPKMEPGIRIKGSPELTQPLVFDLKLPRKKPIKTTLLPTGKQQPAQSQQQDDDHPQPETTE